MSGLSRERLQIGEVERLTPEATLRCARQLLAVVTDAYAHQFERKLRAIPEGTLQAAGYRPDDGKAVDAYRERLAAHMGRGSVYYAVRRLERPEQFVGAIKTTPGANIDSVPNDSLYINDIIVGAAYQYQGVGRQLLDAVLHQPGVSPDTPVALEGFQRSKRVNSWFERIGFINQGPSPEPTAFGAYVLDMDIYQTPDNAGAAHIIAGLHRQR